jgi:ATP-dependent Clp protease ATP-binding subunit ClpB
MFALCTLAFLSAGSVYAQSVTGKAVEVCATTALRQLEKRLAGRKITLDIDPAAKAWLAGEGYDPVYGARPLKRVIQRSLQDPLAEMILSGDVMDGETVTVSAGADGLIIGDRVAPTRRERPMDAVVH